MNWDNVFQIPSENEIRKYNQVNRYRSPYLCAWLTIPSNVHYTEYIIEFKADYVPKGTYCCLGNWKLDYSALKKQYKRVRTEYEWVNAYAGFQRLENGKMVSIMSFWDVVCEDAFGREKIIRAKRVYPQTTEYSETFSGEGKGAHCIVPYEWEANHWYRMHLRCTTSQTTGNTIIEHSVCDMENGCYTLLCCYDLGVKNVSIAGPMAVFLENFAPEYAGEVRTLEACHAKYFNIENKQWESIREAYIEAQGMGTMHKGSYNFGASGENFWMITSGVGSGRNDKKENYYRV